jgi:hypothetical protein
MAKKAKKANKVKKHVAKKATSTKGARRAAAKSAPRASGGAFKVSTGPGASAMELGQQLVSLFNQGKADAWIRKVWSPKIESIEGVGMHTGWRGVKAVEAKNAEWMKTHVLHGGRAEGPFVGSTGFSVKMTMDMEDTTSGKRITMQEIGVYTVKNGKIVREEFMYSCGG